jgi:hypothetical protein
MSEEQPATVALLRELQTKHRELDEKIRELSAEPTGDQLEIARLKRHKLKIKDQIQLIIDSNIPDIIA